MRQSSGNAAGAAQLVRENRGKEIALEFHRAVDSMQAAEEELLREHQADADIAKRAAFINFGGFITTTALLLAALYYLGKKEISRKAQASREYEELANELRKRSDHLTRERNEVAQLNEASNLLQSCDSMAEISVVLGPFLERLFPTTSGAIHIVAASRNRLDVVGTWGNRHFPHHFAPNECWAPFQLQWHSSCFWLLRTSHVS